MRESETASSEILLSLYQQKKEKNAAYSMRAFARDLGVSQTLVSLLLNGKRRLPLKRALHFCARLGLTRAEIRNLLEASALDYGDTPGARTILADALVLQKTKSPRPSEYIRLEIDRFKVIREWYHVAILDLTTVVGFKSEAPWVAGRLGIPLATVRDATKRLVRLGLLEISDGVWKKSSARMVVPTERPEAAIRDFHKQMIGKALGQLELTNQQDFENRYIVGSTMTGDPVKLVEARKLVDQFRVKLARLLASGESTELYQCNLQLFPLTKKKENLK